jgi:hypothetical protein
VVAVIKSLDQALKDGDYIYGTVHRLPKCFAQLLIFDRFWVLGFLLLALSRQSTLPSRRCKPTLPTALGQTLVGDPQRLTLWKFTALVTLPGGDDFSFTNMSAGTKAGDPTEANWVGKKFSDGRASELLITSVKGNIGYVHYISEPFAQR